MDVIPYIELLKSYLVLDRSGKVVYYMKPYSSVLKFAKKHQLTLVRNIVLLLAGSLLLYFRYWVMNFTQPVFRPIDNPHSFAETFIERVIVFYF